MSDDVNQEVHVLDKYGQFVTLLTTGQKIGHPGPMYIDKKGKLWIGVSEWKNKSFEVSGLIVPRLYIQKSTKTTFKMKSLLIKWSVLYLKLHLINTHPELKHMHMTGNMRNGT